MHVVLRGVAAVGGEGGRVVTLERAAEEGAKVSVEMGEEFAVKSTGQGEFWAAGLKTYYCLEVVPLAGLFSMRGAAPPSSRKLTFVPALPPVLVDAMAPLKKLVPRSASCSLCLSLHTYGKRLTSLPSTEPLARIPGTLTSGQVMPSMTGLV